MTADSERSMFKWACLGLAVAAVLALGWMVNDLRRELKRTTVALNERLPPILENTRKSSETLTVLAEDLKQMRDLAGVAKGPRDRSLSEYYDSVLDFIEASGGQIGLKKLLGKGLSDAMPATEWVVGARQEGLLRTTVMRAKSRQEILQHLTNNWRGADWYIQRADQEPQKLLEWLQQNHPETMELPAPTAADERG
jgi:hypothetical protein